VNDLYTNVDHIRENASKRREYYIHNRFDTIPILIKDPFISDEVNMEEFIDEIETRIPRHLLQNIEIIYVGDFPDLDGRNAAYVDGAIYITNKEPTTHDILENVIHEIAHSIESTYGTQIYSDNKLQNEFLGKREKLKAILDSHGYEFPEKYYINTEYTRAFDEFLSDSVGYPTLLSLTMGLFASPYGATSLKEYFANGFEKFYLGEPKLVKETSPVLYNTIARLYTESA
tara:strand:+ start:5292 stop:5981 length:690 start_codon:yes stop_codon:yes gene_type:complete